MATKRTRTKSSQKERSKKSSEDCGEVDARLARIGGLSYLEIPATDPAQSAAFYQKVFGWNVEDAGTDHPKFTDPGGHLLGRWVKRLAISHRPGWLPYVYVNRVDAAVKIALANGGAIVKVPFAEGNLLVAMIRDPAGNVIGVWQQQGY